MVSWRGSQPVSSPEIVLTLDSGGSGAKAHAFDLATRRHAGSFACPYAPATGDPGLFDPAAWWDAAVVALATLVERLSLPATAFAGVTVSAIRIPAVLLDGHGGLTGPSILNTDRRGEEALEELAARVGEDELYSVTGHWPTPKLGLAKLLWTRSHLPGQWRRTAKVLQLHDWFVYRLCGELVSEPSSAAMSQLLDLERGGWSEQVLAAAGIEPGLFPELVPAGTAVGGLVPEVAVAVGLPPGLPVHAGGGDTHVSALAASGLDTSVPVIVAGTTAPAQIALEDLPPAGERFPLFASPHVLPRRYALEANAGTTAGVLAALDGLDEAGGDELAAALVARGFALDGAGGDGGEALCVLSGNPFFGPEEWESWAQPTVVGLTAAHTGRDVRSAALEGVSYAVRGVLETLDARCATSGRPLVLTGGMSTDPAWAQQLADVCAREVVVRPLEAIDGLAGAALVSGVDAALLVAAVESTTFVPRTRCGAEDAYRAYREHFRRGQERARRRGGASRAAPRPRGEGRGRSASVVAGVPAGVAN
jgi:xylulokinase